jgi:murein DD-endopeptidase MepM/ murein hydrolase activator NlpD
MMTLSQVMLLAASVGVGPSLMVAPISGLIPAELHDTFDQSRGQGQGRHEAIDIMEARGTPVQAVVDGTIVKLFLSKPGGNTIYLFDEAGEFCYYYAHLDHYAPNLREGMHVSHGEVIAFVGSTGNASPDAPHLHFAIFKLGLHKRWWKGTPVNPYPVLLRFLQNRTD